MPKQRITREMVIDTAFQIAREEGMEAVLVKQIAQRLECSVQPIYSYCQNMEDLKQEVRRKTGQFFLTYLQSQRKTDDFFRSTGISYLNFAKEEPHLFKLFVLRKRTEMHSLEDMYAQECSKEVTQFIAKDLNLPFDKAKAFHLNMVFYSMGIASILATSESDIPMQELTSQLDMAYDAFLKQAQLE